MSHRVYPTRVHVSVVSYATQTEDDAPLPTEIDHIRMHAPRNLDIHPHIHPRKRIETTIAPIPDFPDGSFGEPRRGVFDGVRERVDVGRERGRGARVDARDKMKGTELGVFQGAVRAGNKGDVRLADRSYPYF